MPFPRRLSIFAHEPLFRGVPPDGGRQGREVRRSAADDPPSSSLLECWQSAWPISRSRHRAGPRPVLAPPQQSIADDPAMNSELAELSFATEDCYGRNRWPCSAADTLRAPAQRAGPESSARLVSGDQPYLESPEFRQSAYPLRVSRRGRRRLSRALVCSQSAGRFRLFLALSLA